MAEREQPDFELVTGHAEFAARALALVASARMELALLTQELDERIYCTPAFVEALKNFILQQPRSKVRILINKTQRAVSGGSRLVELGRALSSFVEFRELNEERRQGTREEYLIADGRQMVYREAPEDLQAKFYGQSPHLVKLKLKDFSLLWSESTTAQELRNLRI